MNDVIVGTCSICGGPVVIPSIILSTVQPTPFCRKCGARKVEDYGPTIKMEPLSKKSGTNSPETQYNDNNQSIYDSV